MEDTMTQDQKWSIIEVALQKTGIDTGKIKPLQRAPIIAQVEADEVIGSDDEVWQEYAESLVEEHPTWAGETFHRLKNATELIEGWHSDPDGGMFGQERTPEDLTKQRYAMVAWYDKSTIVYPAGDTLKDVLKSICELQYQSDSDEYVDFIEDLNTGERISAYTELSTTFTLSLRGEEYTYQS